MTLVFERNVPGAATHACIIGCGRFKTYKPDGTADRPGTVAGARDMVRFLIQQRDELIAPLATIHCVLSDPANAVGQDMLGIGPHGNDPRPDDAVDAATTLLAKAAADAWALRGQAGDTMLFYMASHGFVDTDMTALGAFEDLGASQLRPFENAINVTRLAIALPPHIMAAHCFVFLDACQEMLEALFQQYGGAGALNLLHPSLQAFARTPVRSVALASSRVGQKAWAPPNGTAPYFTKALLEGMATCCVEQVRDQGWVVTGNRLTNGVASVADAALDYSGMETEQLVPNNRPAHLMRVANPMIPIAVRTVPEGHINFAQSVSADDGNGHVIPRTDNALTWKFRVPPSRAEYKAQALFPGMDPPSREGRFPADAPAQIVELRP